VPVVAGAIPSPPDGRSSGLPRGAPLGQRQWIVSRDRGSLTTVFASPLVLVCDRDGRVVNGGTGERGTDI